MSVSGIIHHSHSFTRLENITSHLFHLSLLVDGAVSVLNGSHYAPEGSDVSINCSITGEAFKGWFDSKDQPISNKPSQRLHVKSEGSLQFLEINRVSKTDYGRYECRGEKNKTQVMLYVECK